MNELKQSLKSSLFAAYITGRTQEDRKFNEWESENRVVELIIKDIESLLKKEYKRGRIDECNHWLKCQRDYGSLEVNAPLYSGDFEKRNLELGGGSE